MTDIDWNEIKRRVDSGDTVIIPDSKGLNPAQVVELVEAAFPDDDVLIKAKTEGDA